MNRTPAERASGNDYATSQLWSRALWEHTTNWTESCTGLATTTRHFASQCTTVQKMVWEWFMIDLLPTAPRNWRSFSGDMAWA